MENENQANEAYWRLRIVSVVYPVNVTEAALGKQAGRGLLDWGNTDEIYKKTIWKGPD
jgi:hypothetical protein